MIPPPSSQPDPSRMPTPASSDHLSLPPAFQTHGTIHSPSPLSSNPASTGYPLMTAHPTPPPSSHPNPAHQAHLVESYRPTTPHMPMRTSTTSFFAMPTASSSTTPPVNFDARPDAWTPPQSQGVSSHLPSTPISSSRPMSAADLMMHRVQAREQRTNVGERVMHAIAGIKMLLDALNPVFEKNHDVVHQVRDRLHDLQTSQRALATRSEITDDIAAQISAALHDQNQVTKDLIDESLETVSDKITVDISNNVVQNLQTLFDRLSHLIGNKQLSNGGDEASNKLINLLIDKLDPISTVCDALPALRHLPEAVQNVAAFKSAMDAVASRTLETHKVISMFENSSANMLNEFRTSSEEVFANLQGSQQSSQTQTSEPQRLTEALDGMTKSLDDLKNRMDEPHARQTRQVSNNIAPPEEYRGDELLKLMEEIRDQLKASSKPPPPTNLLTDQTGAQIAIALRELRETTLASQRQQSEDVKQLRNTLETLQAEVHLWKTTSQPKEHTQAAADPDTPASNAAQLIWKLAKPTRAPEMEDSFARPNAQGAKDVFGPEVYIPSRQNKSPLPATKDTVHTISNRPFDPIQPTGTTKRSAETSGLTTQDDLHAKRLRSEGAHRRQPVATKRMATDSQIDSFRDPPSHRTRSAVSGQRRTIRTLDPAGGKSIYDPQSDPKKKTRSLAPPQGVDEGTTLETAISVDASGTTVNSSSSLSSLSITKSYHNTRDSASNQAMGRSASRLRSGRSFHGRDATAGLLSLPKPSAPGPKKRTIRALTPETVPPMNAQDGETVNENTDSLESRIGAEQETQIPSQTQEEVETYQDTEQDQYSMIQTQPTRRLTRSTTVIDTQLQNTMTTEGSPSPSPNIAEGQGAPWQTPNPSRKIQKYGSKGNKALQSHEAQQRAAFFNFARNEGESEGE